MKSLVLILSLAAATSALGSETAATDVSARPAVNIRYDDLDLARPVDLATLYQRLTRGANHVCAGILFASTFTRQQYDDCRTGAIGRAVADLNRPSVTSYVSGRVTLPHDVLTRIATIKPADCVTAICR